MYDNVIEIYSILGFSEPVSCLTHLLGAGLFAVLSVFLLRRGRGNRLRVVSLGVFAFSCVFLLSMSGVYHWVDRGGDAKAVMVRIDVAGIFVLIAGTFTPAHVILFRGLARWTPLAFIWSVAITGLTLRAIFGELVPEWLGLAVFLGMGWVGALAMLSVWRRFGWKRVEPLLLGAVAYTVGALLEFARQPVLIPGVIGPHELFHVAVLAGIGLHWKFIHTIAGGVDVAGLNA